MSDRPDDFVITFDGEPVPATAGETIAAVLIRAGYLGWRRTRGSGEPRGLFCGMGVCFDCLVTINGVPSARACLVTAEPGDIVTTERGVPYDDLAL
jgi:hypothetical protein